MFQCLRRLNAQSMFWRSPRFAYSHTATPLAVATKGYFSTSSSNPAQFPFYVPPFNRNTDKYNAYTHTDVNYLKSLLTHPSSQFLEKYEDVLPYCTDWLRVYRSLPLQNMDAGEADSDNLQAPKVVFPNTVEEISSILSYCNNRKLPVSIQGGNTGLVGGSIPIFDELQISVSRLDRILHFDPQTGILECEAGCILHNINEYLQTTTPKYIAPLDLGSKGSCQIGGNTATNAGGLRFIRYGRMSGNCLGLEAVLADGSIFNSMSNLKKDNTGLKLHQLFIGSEGILGIITKVIIQCVPHPNSVQLCLLKFPTFSKLVEAATEAKKKLSDILSAVEFLDHQCLVQTLRHVPNVKPVFNIDPSKEVLDNHDFSSDSFYLLIETHGQQSDFDQQRVMAFTEELLESEIAADGIWCEHETQKNEIWKIREGAASALPHQGKTWKYDFSLPLQEMYTIIEAAREKLEDIPGAACVGYGHIGDGNIHLNVLGKDPQWTSKIAAILEPWVYEFVHAKGGSISAEHGLGVNKADKIHMAKSPGYLQLLKAVKNVFDPHAILNPYKVYR